MPAARPATRRAAALALALLALAACAAPSPKPARAEAAAKPVPSAPDVAPSDPPAEDPPAPAPGPVPASAPTCAEADLALAVAGFDVALGSRYLLLAATNASDQPCSVGGRPDLTFVRMSGTMTPGVTLVPRTTGGPDGGAVVLVPGDTAYSELRWSAMSTTQDPDESVAVRVRAVPGARGVEVLIDPPPDADGGVELPPRSIDVLAGAEVEVGPWRAEVEGWSVP